MENVLYIQDFFFQETGPASNVRMYQIWGNSYQTLAGVNLVISKLDLDLKTMDERAAIEGEAKFYSLHWCISRL